MSNEASTLDFFAYWTPFIVGARRRWSLRWIASFAADRQDTIVWRW